MDALSRIAGPPPSSQVVTKPSFPPTPEQEAIVTAVTETKDNLQLIAYAGSGKTSTLVLVANHPVQQVIPTICIAFNKKIADEMKSKLPPNCTSSTINALGHKTWYQAIGRRLNVQTKKNYDIIKALVDAEKNRQRKEDLYGNFAELIRTLAHGKSSGWVPDSCLQRTPKALLTDEEFFDGLDEELHPYEQDLLTQAMLISIEQSYNGLIDFDDQVFMPTCFPSRWPDFPLWMVDEAQDLSALNHAMLEQCVRNDRLIAVGDPCQAIYAFRGAYGDSMERLRHKFNMRVLPLSTSFRCPKAVVREANWRAPEMNSPQWAKEGAVIELTEWSIDSLPHDAVIICRNNAPLFKMAITILIEGRFPQLVGNDIGKTLLKALDKLGPRETPREAAYSLLEDYRLKRLSRARDHAKGSVEDFCLCLRIFLDHGETLGAAKGYAEHLMNTTGPVKLMTGHKSKGLEFPSVFILDRQLLRLEAEGGKNQDKNLLYVMQTRAQETLTYITTEKFIPSELREKE